MIGTPVYAGFTSSAASSAAYPVGMVNPVPPGATVVVFAGASGSTAATAVADTQGNVYTAGPSNTTGQYLQAFTGVAAAGLNPLDNDGWTVTFAAANTQTKNIIAVAVTGCAAADIGQAASGTSASPAVTGTATGGNEVILACVQNANAGGSPSFPAPLTSLGGLTPSGQQVTFTAWEYLTAAGPVTASATIASASWAALLVSLTAAPPAALGSSSSPSGGAQLPPYPVLPAPATWSGAEKALAPGLRADPGNALSLLANPPLFIGGQTLAGQSVATGTITPLQLDTEMTDSWQSHAIPAATIAPPLAGWYLAEGFANLNDTVTGQTALVGVQAVQGGTTSSSDGGRVSGNGVNNPIPACADLLQVNPATGDTLALYAYQTSGAAKTVASAYFKTEWALAPSGTVVSSPVPAAGWTPGATTLLAPVAAGATSAVVADPSGVVTGGTVALDYGSAAQESATVTSALGQTIGFAACSYPHPAAAPVSVPISAAWMNQQVRDKISFLAYRPAARLSSQAAPSQATIPSQTWPAGTAIQWGPPGTTGARCMDNFGGYSAGTPTRYTFPVSGVYYVYGQVYIADAATTVLLSAGIAIGGSILAWGDRVLSAGNSTTVCATVRKAAVRVTAGQYAEIWGSQGSGSALSVKNSGNTVCKLVVLFRGL